MLPIQFQCPGCGQPIEVDEQYAGKSAGCPYCRQVVTVPLTSTYAPSGPVTARPASGDAWHPPVPPPMYVGDLPPTPTSAPANNRLGTFSLVAASLAVVACVAAMLSGLAVGARMGPALNLSDRPTPDEMRLVQSKLEQLAQDNPGVFFPFCGSLLAAVGLSLLGITLSMFSLAQRSRGNWMGYLSLALSGAVLVGFCGCMLLSAVMRGGA